MLQAVVVNIRRLTAGNCGHWILVVSVMLPYPSWCSWCFP